MQGFLLDIDGTTLLGTKALPGALEFISGLRARQVPFLWLTNNTSLSREGWLGRLSEAGLAPTAAEIYTAGDATIDFLLALDPVPRIQLVGTRDLRRAFEEAGLRLAGPDADALVLGYDTELTYEKLKNAALLLARGVPFYATHPDATCPTPEGPIPDVGSFLALFEKACGRRAVVIGKPEASMASGALARLGVEAKEAVMVGDRLETDIRMANRAGLTSCLVLTGVTKRADLAEAADGPHPDQPRHVFESLEELERWATRS